MLSALPKIDILPEHLIDQIKAGEVIERPGNLIKEILENAVDAKATRLELTLKNNGMDLISLKDNGHGMRLDDLPLAFSRHATSKISRFEDLYHLNSFGFRGEALASIASIAKVQCLSFVENDHTGGEVKIEGGLVIFHGPRQNSQNSHGTELIIQDLFFNTPARLKFIQSQQSEKLFIKKIIYAFILSHPEIEFIIKIDDEEKEIFPITSDLKSRLEQIVPKAKDHILKSERFYENNEFELYLIPAHFKVPVKWQNIFINGRYILDKQFHRVLTNALMSSFGHDDFYYLAFIHLPPDTIDVNVHPNKTVIKCLDVSKILSLMTSSIKELAALTIKNQKIPHHEMGSNTFLQDLPNLSGAMLKQERHEYNMEGLFSPHHIQQTNDELLWIGSFFIKIAGTQSLAINAKKLLSFYILNKLEKVSPTIPLLVSEPFKSQNINQEMLQKLTSAGAELETLGPDTIVLRGIPLWMNGFPLKDIMNSLLHNHQFEDLEINPSDWPQSSWIEMLEESDVTILRSQKILTDVHKLLSDKLK